MFGFVFCSSARRRPLVPLCQGSWCRLGSDDRGQGRGLRKRRAFCLGSTMPCCMWVNATAIWGGGRKRPALCGRAARPATIIFGAITVTSLWPTDRRQHRCWFLSKKPRDFLTYLPVFLLRKDDGNFGLPSFQGAPFSASVINLLCLLFSSCSMWMPADSLIEHWPQRAGVGWCTHWQHVIEPLWGCRGRRRTFSCSVSTKIQQSAEAFRVWYFRAQIWMESLILPASVDKILPPVLVAHLSITPS